MHNYEVSAANLAELKAILTKAEKTGQIAAKALELLANSIRRDARFEKTATYLESKALTLPERRRIQKAMQTRTNTDERALEAIAETYRRGDIPQMLSAVEKLPLTTAERRAVELAREDNERGDRRTVNLRHGQLKDIFASRGIAPALQTVRVVTA